MFALGAWDRQERVLVLARDRLGEKPLYYGRVGAAFAFASELRAIRRLPQCPTEPDPQALGEYLRFGFVPSPLSILPGIHKLPAGCVLRVSARGEPGSPVPYWSLVDVARAGLASPLSAPVTTSSSTSRTRRLRRSVERRIEADVPVGAFLSGGVDSSTIVALAQAVSRRPVRTFTVAVGGSRGRVGGRGCGGAPPRHRPHHAAAPGDRRRRPGRSCRFDLRRALRRPVGHADGAAVRCGAAARDRVPQR